MYSSHYPRQINTSLRAGQNIHTFLSTVRTACHVTPKIPFLCSWNDLLLAPALFWPDTVANQVSICWRLRGPLELPIAANTQFFECCMSSYRSPDLNYVLWPPKQLFERRSATDMLLSFRYISETNDFNRYIGIEANTSLLFSGLGYSFWM